MKKIIESSNAPGAVGPYSQAVVIDLKEYSKLIYTSGQLPINPETKSMPKSIEEQTEMSIKNVVAVLKEQDMTLDNVIKSTVFLDSITDFKAMNEVYARYFDKPFPARSAFEVAKLPLGALVEIEVVAGK